MARGRVQVNDLAPPEPIRPYGIQSDTYARPAAPPINNDYERLASALGQFSSAAMGAARRLEANAERARAEAEAQAEADANARFLQWELETSSPDRIAAYENGTAPIGFVKEQLWKTAKANDYGEAFAQTVGDKIARGQVEGWGTEGFNVDTFVMEEARPYVEILQGDQTQLATFAKHFDKVGNHARSEHAKLIGALRVERDETEAQKELRRGFRATVSNPVLKGQVFGGVDEATRVSLQDINRELYAAMGPGTPLNIPYARLDELQLAMLNDEAGDVRYAEAVIAMLHEERTSVDGNNLKLGSFISSTKHGDKAQQIEAKALKTLATAYEDQAKKAVRQNGVIAFNRRDGSYFQFQDATVPNPYDPAKPITVSAETRRKEAADSWLAASRAANGGRANLALELETFAANNVKHPELAATLEGTFKGLGALNGKASDIGPDTVAAVADAYEMYQVASGMGHNYVEETLLDKDTVRFYEGIRYAVEYLGLDAQTAAATVTRLYATPEGRDSPNFSPEVLADIDAKAQSVSKWGFFNDEHNENPTEVKNRIVRLATLFVQLGTAPDKAVERAAERVNEQSLFINGRRTWGLAGLVKDDSEVVTSLMEDFYKAQPADVLKAQGIESASDMRLVQGAQGRFHIVNEYGIPVFGAGKQPLTLTIEDVAARRKTREEIAQKLGAKAALDNQEAVRRAHQSGWVTSPLSRVKQKRQTKDKKPAPKPTPYNAPLEDPQASDPVEALREYLGDLPVEPKPPKPFSGPSPLSRANR